MGLLFYGSVNFKSVFFLKLHYPKKEKNIRQNSALILSNILFIFWAMQFQEKLLLRFTDPYSWSWQFAFDRGYYEGRAIQKYPQKKFETICQKIRNESTLQISTGQRPESKKLLFLFLPGNDQIFISYNRPNFGWEKNRPSADYISH